MTQPIPAEKKASQVIRGGKGVAEAIKEIRNEASISAACSGTEMFRALNRVRNLAINLLDRLPSPTAPSSDAGKVEGGDPLEGVTVKGRKPHPDGAGESWSIFDDSEDFVELRPDGVWHDVNDAEQHYWPTEAAAVAFIHEQYLLERGWTKGPNSASNLWKVPFANMERYWSLSDAVGIQRQRDAADKPAPPAAEPENADDIISRAFDEQTQRNTSTVHGHVVSSRVRPPLVIDDSEPAKGEQGKRLYVHETHEYDISIGDTLIGWQRVCCLHNDPSDEREGGRE